MTESERAELRQYFDEQFAGLNQQFAQIDDRFAQMDQRFDKIDERFDTIDKQSVDVRADIKGVDDRVDRLEGHVEDSTKFIVKWISDEADRSRRFTAQRFTLVGPKLRAALADAAAPERAAPSR